MDIRNHVAMLSSFLSIVEPKDEYYSEASDCIIAVFNVVCDQFQNDFDNYGSFEYIKDDFMYCFNKYLSIFNTKPELSTMFIAQDAYIIKIKNNKPVDLDPEIEKLRIVSNILSRIKYENEDENNEESEMIIVDIVTLIKGVPIAVIDSSSIFD
jgi:hypothetical protein